MRKAGLDEMSAMIVRFRNKWSHGLDYQISLEDRWDFAAFYQTFYLQSYTDLRIEEGDSVLDAGAHIGTWTVLASVLTGPTGHVVAVEPDQSNFEKLKRNLQLNGTENVRAVRKALWSRRGETVKLIGEGVTVKVSSRGTQAVATETIDSLAGAAGGHFDKIKMDIEGAESEALKGALKSFPKCRQVVLEVHGSRNLDYVKTLFRKLDFEPRLASPEPLSLALTQTISHPLLTLALEWNNRFRTSLRVLKDLKKRVNKHQEGSEDLWLLFGTR